MARFDINGSGKYSTYKNASKRLDLLLIELPTRQVVDYTYR